MRSFPTSGRNSRRARNTLLSMRSDMFARRALGAAVFTYVCLFEAALASAESKPPENPAEALEMPTVEIIGTTPLPGLGTPTRDVPANVQVFTSKDLAGQGQTNMTAYLQ